MTLSLCMIVRNEELVLDRCLKSCGDLFDEIIIVDTGSSDNTIDIAKKYTDKVYTFKWVDDFSKARNYSFSLASSDYIMWLDADDIITGDNLNKLKNLKRHLNDIDVVMLKYAISFDANNSPLFTFFRERILRRSSQFVWEDPVHEVITPKGKIVYEDIIIEHRKVKENPSGRNLKIYRKLVSEKIRLKPRQMFYYARELYFNNYISESINMFKKFLNTKNGYIENYIEACLDISKCYQIKNNTKSALKYLFLSFSFDLPRAEILCEIGNIYVGIKDYNKATYYYHLALNTKMIKNSGGFVLNDCYEFIPCLELSVCYYYLGDFKLAKFYHEKAKAINSLHPTIIENDKFFCAIN